MFSSLCLKINGKSSKVKPHVVSPVRWGTAQKAKATVINCRLRCSAAGRMAGVGVEVVTHTRSSRLSCLGCLLCLLSSPFLNWVWLPKNQECEQNNIFFRRNRKSLVSGNTYYISARNLWYSCGQMCVHTPSGVRWRKKTKNTNKMQISKSIMIEMCAGQKKSISKFNYTKYTFAHTHTYRERENKWN